MRKGEENTQVSNDPRHHRPQAVTVLQRAKEFEKQREQSDQWEWVQVDSRTRVLRKRKKRKAKSCSAKK